MATQEDIALMGHLLRRAGFGASRAEIEAKATRGYDAVVEELLNPETQPALEDDLVLRYFPVYNHSANIQTNVQQWVYWMINNPRQLQEKMSLFWHMIFCAGHSKIDSGEEMVRMIDMFRQHGMGNFRDLLMRLSTSPAMMYYLDNTESHKVAVNENYGRELLELFSLGVGKDEAFNYTEDDVKACARAFTGWNNAPGYPPSPTAVARGSSAMTRRTTMIVRRPSWVRPVAGTARILSTSSANSPPLLGSSQAPVQLLRRRRSAGAVLAPDAAQGCGSH